MRAGRWGTLLSILLALAASGSVYWYLRGLEERFPVVVTKGRVERGAQLGPEDVRLTYLPQDAISPLALVRLQDTVGRYACETLYPGEQLLRTRVARPEEMGIPGGLPETARAMFLPLSLEQVGGGIAVPGREVDVILVTDGREYPAGAKILAQGLRILDVRDAHGQSWSPGREVPLGVVVQVTPEEAERLAFALEHGVLYLTLRPPQAPVMDTPGARWDNLCPLVAVP